MQREWLNSTWLRLKKQFIKQELQTLAYQLVAAYTREKSKGCWSSEIYFKIVFRVLCISFYPHRGAKEWSCYALIQSQLWKVLSKTAFRKRLYFQGVEGIILTGRLLMGKITRTCSLVFQGQVWRKTFSVNLCYSIEFKGLNQFLTLQPQFPRTT